MKVISELDEVIISDFNLILSNALPGCVYAPKANTYVFTEINSYLHELVSKMVGDDPETHGVKNYLKECVVTYDDYVAWLDVLEKEVLPFIRDNKGGFK